MTDEGATLRKRAARARLRTYAAEPTQDRGWREEAACRDLPREWWFPPAAPAGHRDTQLDATDALLVCRDCPARPACLAYALKPRETAIMGIFGGTTERQRQVMRRTRRSNPPPIVIPDDAGDVARILDVTARILDVDPVALMESRDRRDRATIDARHVAAAVARAVTGLSYPRLGAVLDRDHSSVMSGVRRVHATPRLRALVEAVMAELKGTGAA